MTQVVGAGRADNLFKLMQIQYSVNETHASQIYCGKHKRKFYGCETPGGTIIESYLKQVRRNRKPKSSK